MLELRPNCECCDRNLPPDSPNAMICSYECTFCRACVDTVLENVCPNCGGGFSPRPVRPRKAWRPRTGLGSDPPSTKRVLTKLSRDELAAFAAAIKLVAPIDR